MHRLLILLIATLAVQNSLTANTTITSSGCAACSVSTGGFANCAVCDTSGNTFCQACKPGYMIGNVQASGSSTTGPSYCATACTGNCFYCVGQQTAPSNTAAAFTTASSQTAYCMVDNNYAVTAPTYANAICANTTTSGVTTYATPSTPLTAASNDSPPRPVGSYSCFTCMSNCINCRPAGGAPTTQNGVTTCSQCANGYYQDQNSTVSGATVGSACTACASIPSVSGTTSNSAYIVVGVCNTCVNKTGCINATCTKFTGTTAGVGTADTTSYKFNMATQTCVATFAGKLSVAVVGVVAVVFATMF